jgi:hypothetical protein
VRNANQDIFAMQQRFSDALPLLAKKHGADFRAVVNGFTPLYIAGSSSVEAAVRGVLSVLELSGVSTGDEVNRAIGDAAAPTSVFQAVANGADPLMLRLLHECGGDLEAPRVALNAQHEAVQSTPPLHLALLQMSQTGDPATVQELLALGAKADSCYLGPWLQSELIKKLTTGPDAHGGERSGRRDVIDPDADQLPDERGRAGRARAAAAPRPRRVAHLRGPHVGLHRASQGGSSLFVDFESQRKRSQRCW